VLLYINTWLVVHPPHTLPAYTPTLGASILAPSALDLVPSHPNPNPGSGPERGGLRLGVPQDLAYDRSPLLDAIGLLSGTVASPTGIDKRVICRDLVNTTSLLIHRRFMNVF